MQLVQVPDASIDYDHVKNNHTFDTAHAALSVIFGTDVPFSLLDVGCGTGTWLRAASQLGVSEIYGVDGIIVGDSYRHVTKDVICQHDLSVPFNLNRRFDLVLCLEVAEHIPQSSSQVLVSSLATHSDTILFSAACPGQHGQHHINCQWPAYWQEHFNRHGFVCVDLVRWQTWDQPRIDPWYRQNIFKAYLDRQMAGQEPRLKSVVHPDMHAAMSSKLIQDAVQRIELGEYPPKWYLRAIARSTRRSIANRAHSWFQPRRE
jgi:hypothetical protein